MSQTPIASIAKFIDATRADFAASLPAEALWARAADNLPAVLADPLLRESARSWPGTMLPDGPANLLFYEDPDYRFVLNALIKGPDTATTIHDHGPSWTLYGVLEGSETVERFDLTKPKDAEKPIGDRLTLTGSDEVRAGFVDLVAPWAIHRETTGSDRSVAFIVRSQRSGTFPQFRYDPENVGALENRGPSQIPYPLA